MPQLTINNLRQVEWGRGYLWSAYFIGDEPPPHPFTDWLPAVSITETLAVLNSYSTVAYLEENFKIPQSGGKCRQISMSLIDNVDCVLEHWFEHWINYGIKNNGDYMSTLDQCTKTLVVEKLDTQRRPIITKHYLVYPEDQITFGGTNESDPHQLEVNLIVVGESH